MAKLFLLLVFVCFQFSNQEELTDIKIPNDELTNEKTQIPVDNEMLDGEDENQWYKEREEDDKFDEEWTEDDEKWFQQIQDVLTESDEDYDDDDDDDDFEAIEQLIDDIEVFIQKSYPEKSTYKWLFDIEKWFNDDLYDDDDYDMYPDLKKKENLDVEVDDKNKIDLYYSWLYKVRNSKTKRAQPLKRFWSV